MDITEQQIKELARTQSKKLRTVICNVLQKTHRQSVISFDEIFIEVPNEDEETQRLYRDAVQYIENTKAIEVTRHFYARNLQFEMWATLGKLFSITEGLPVRYRVSVERNTLLQVMETYRKYCPSLNVRSGSQFDAKSGLLSIGAHEIRFLQGSDPYNLLYALFNSEDDSCTVGDKMDMVFILEAIEKLTEVTMTDKKKIRNAQGYVNRQIEKKTGIPKFIKTEGQCLCIDQKYL